MSVLLFKVNLNYIVEMLMKIADDYGMMNVLVVVVFQYNFMNYIYIYCFCFVNSPLLLELPPRGQVQVAMDR